MNSAGTHDRAHEHCWRYFEIHASHRLTIFNYFLILSGLLAAGLAASLQGSGHLPLFGLVLGVLLAFVSFVFWKLDQRASFFIKRSEEALAQLEGGFSHPGFQLFHGEPTATCETRKAAPRWNPHWTYGRSFRIVFSAMAACGILGGLLSLGRYLGWLSIGA